MYVFMYFTGPVWTNDWMMTGDPLVMTGGGLPGERGWLPPAFPLVPCSAWGISLGDSLPLAAEGEEQFNSMNNV